MARFGYFVGAVLFHLILFVMLATWIVFKAPASQADSANFLTVAIPPRPPPAPPAPSGGEVANNFEPSAQMVPPPTVPTIIAVSNASTFALNAEKVTIPNLPPALAAPPAGSALAGHDAPGEETGAGSPFGSSNSSSSAQMEGYLYDLKQTRDGDPNQMNPGLYEQKILQFINSDWDESVLRDFYKCPKGLSTSSIFVPIINAEDGPKAFGVDDRVKPNLYCVLYKVTASPPQEGTYHFVGTADDIMFVRVNGKTVLDGTDFGIDKDLRAQEKSFQMTNFKPTFANNANFWIGLPFHVSAGESVNIEVLIGEEPGGKSDYFLFIQRDESTYQTQSNGSPLLPIFQLDANPVKPSAEPMSFPPSAATPEPWTPVTEGM